jgi:hypothetical protein
MEGRLPFSTGMATADMMPLGEVNTTVMRPEVVLPSKLKLRRANEACDVLGTGDPPSRVTVKPVDVVEAVIVVPAAMGFKRVLLASAAIRVIAPDALEPVYQVWPATRVKLDMSSVGEGPT